ncbi:MAG TPA: SRPBCC domain-containing protein [Bacteroidia bacterium]|nr:SRPBCC domain-containing protein [Bacteroidia bacterium]
MKHLITLLTTLTIMSTSATKAQNGKATTVKTTFHRETSVSIEIKADAAIVWALLTKASDYTRWNSTVTSIEGNIALGEKIKLKSILDAKRTFKLKVKEFVPENKLVWGDGQGNRVYTITKNTNGTVTFNMTEKIGGLMFPMYAKMIPSFDQSFEQFASDLKKESETIMNAK